MEPVQFSKAVELTGLSESQLREWCGKRGLFQPTVRARGSGQLALYSWQDIIALRIFREIVSVFGGRASGWSAGVSGLRQRLNGFSYPALWGRWAVFLDQQTAKIEVITSASLSQAALIVPLDPHLVVLADRRSLGDGQGQLPLLAPIRTGR